MANRVLALPCESAQWLAARRERFDRCGGGVALSTGGHAQTGDRYGMRMFEAVGMFGDVESAFDRALVDDLERSGVDRFDRRA